jgi:zinc D-Ala-D-Ala carboxypeptidase
MSKEMLSPHLSVEEFEFSPTAIRLDVPNKMIPEHKENARQLALKLFEPIRAFRGAPIRINSGYRSLELNKRIGGAKSSQHMKGEAVDLPLTLREAKFIMESLDWDQLIFEHPVNGKPSWVHVSYTTHRKNRKQVLIAVKQNGITKYLPYKCNEKLIY